MSGHGFHVHDLHNHYVDHAATHCSDSVASKTAVTAAVLAVLGPIFG